MTAQEIAVEAALAAFTALAKYLAGNGKDPRAELEAAFAAGDIAADAAENEKFG
jgi:erythromycin esterase-like protein